VTRRPAYETIGVGYRARRRADPRIERQILAAVGDARSVLNVGAGTGSYEPTDRLVVALEPSSVMIDQRPAGAAPVIRGVAEALPVPDNSFETALAVLTVHHWTDIDQGLRELRRVSGRQVLLTFDMVVASKFWLWPEYFPATNSVEAARAPTVERIVEALGAETVEVVPVPHDCTDGFGGAYWRRPEAYLDPEVRAGISSLAVLDDADIQPGVDRLRADLESGAWHERHGDLLELDEIDLGYRLIVSGR
jgi:SAM-dependent methyltransferase